MKFSAIRTFALALPDVTELPHHHFGSFRVRGRIFVTFPPDEALLRVFVPEKQREQALVLYPAVADKLLWGGKVVGLTLTLTHASPVEIKLLVRQAWQARLRRRCCGEAFDAAVDD